MTAKELIEKHELLKLKHIELKEACEAAIARNDNEMMDFWLKEATAVFEEACRTHDAIELLLSS